MQTQISVSQDNASEELKALKSRFINRISHDFQEPLSIIILSTELLTHHSHTWDAETKLQHLHRIQAAVLEMTQMLEESLNQSLESD
ncbi:hypothetical protein NG798_11990 [Ancylothrix sp. C2]|uniref:histidine kinase dimerization/phospho-acceptor domain-containing protein n=1 Tax=Ancylothrix sp. D3o TaxID=2953691 RepID=UPI0021BB6C6F|nr:histidine kinase dimerization/phospho-acceptor domain-containing protein [Ancylothrix sp. D3o]MCT7950512.1 hypothetical protein [Ancylothrix sp. D3o]